MSTKNTMQEQATNHSLHTSEIYTHLIVHLEQVEDLWYPGIDLEMTLDGFTEVHIFNPRLSDCTKTSDANAIVARKAARDDLMQTNN